LIKSNTEEKKSAGLKPLKRLEFQGRGGGNFEVRQWGKIAKRKREVRTDIRLSRGQLTVTLESKIRGHGKRKKGGGETGGPGG